MKKSGKKNIRYRIVTIAIIVFIIVMAIAGNSQIEKYDNSVFNIYAGQQDAYVQLVLEQINLQKDRSDEQIISEILGTLDASNGKYWTLSKNQALVFVKNISETNKYKGFTTETYYMSKSAEEFLKSLTKNHVRHSVIEMDGEKYVASGVVFDYNDTQYKICLLTSETIILDDNQYLFSKIMIYVYITVIFIVMLILTMMFANLVDLKDKQNKVLNGKIEGLNKNVDRLENKIKALNYYQTRWSIYNGELIGKFVEKLDERKVAPITFAKVYFGTKEDMENSLDKAQLLLDERVLRFSEEKYGVEFIFVKYNKGEAMKALERVHMKNAVIEKICTYEGEQESLSEIFSRYMEK